MRNTTIFRAVDTSSPAIFPAVISPIGSQNQEAFSLRAGLW